MPNEVIQMHSEYMKMKIMLPFKVFDEKENIKRIIVETIHGSFGILPNRLDCVASIVPGILTDENEAGGEIYVAVDDGILLKFGDEVFISVHNAIAGKDLGTLKDAVEHEFKKIDEREQSVRMVLAKLERGLAKGLSGRHNA
jgi:F-type H+-transporting ATPase subunit epsilon